MIILWGPHFANTWIYPIIKTRCFRRHRLERSGCSDVSPIRHGRYGTLLARRRLHAVHLSRVSQPARPSQTTHPLPTPSAAPLRDESPRRKPHSAHTERRRRGRAAEDVERRRTRGEVEGGMAAVRESHRSGAADLLRDPHSRNNGVLHNEVSDVEAVRQPFTS